MAAYGLGFRVKLSIAPYCQVATCFHAISSSSAQLTLDEVVHVSETLQGVEKEFYLGHTTSATWRLTRSKIESRANTAETARMQSGCRLGLTPEHVYKEMTTRDGVKSRRGPNKRCNSHRSDY